MIDFRFTAIKDLIIENQNACIEGMFQGDKIAIHYEH